MKNYIFISAEGYTYQPGSESIQPDIENLQVIGFAKGNNSKNAFRKLVQENGYLAETSFDEIISYELTRKAESSRSYHYLAELR
ncbi:MAG: hypothetical protein KJ619_00380 [Candidatus Omnitrophica bacterium]|nr:hypothetical protein [Candidatus Omnitrophota bacterium]